MTQDCLYAELKALNAFSLAQKVSLYQSIDSTNSELLRRLSKASGKLTSKSGALTQVGKDLHLQCALSASQTAGRGRIGRSFYSPQNSGIYFSFIYVPEGGIQNPALYTVTAAVGIARAIKALYQKDCSIKWVNDLYLGQKKICGILTEGFSSPAKENIEACVIGIGINVFQNPNAPFELQEKIGSILNAGEESSVPLERLFARSLVEILHSLESKEDTLLEYRKKSMLIGKTVLVTPLVGQPAQYSAKVLGISKSAGLIVQLENGSQAELHSGEVSLH